MEIVFFFTEYLFIAIFSSSRLGGEPTELCGRKRRIISGRLDWIDFDLKWRACANIFPLFQSFESRWFRFIIDVEPVWPRDKKLFFFVDRQMHSCSFVLYIECDYIIGKRCSKQFPKPTTSFFVLCLVLPPFLFLRPVCLQQLPPLPYLSRTRNK